MSQELKNRIHADYPELRDPRLPDWDKARILRTWTWSLVDVAWPPMSYDQQKDWHRSEADRLVERFDSDKGGVWCEGAAFTLQKIYALYGFEAYLITLSQRYEQGWGSHTMTLIHIEDGSRRIWSLQDSYFDNAITDAGGRPLDYVEFLQRLKARRLHEVGLKEFDVPVRFLPAVIVPAYKAIGKTEKEIAYNHWPVDLDSYSVKRLDDGSVKIVSRRMLSQYIARFDYFKELLAANRVPTDPIYYFLFADTRVSGSSPKAQALRRGIRAIQREQELLPLLSSSPPVWHTTRGFREGRWNWSTSNPDGRRASISVPGAGAHTLNIWMGEDGTCIDKLILTQNPDFTPNGNDPHSGSDGVLLIDTCNLERNIPRSGSAWILKTDKPGFTDCGYMQALPLKGLRISRKEAVDTAPELQFSLQFRAPGTYFVWVRENCTSKFSDCIHLGTDGEVMDTMDFSF